MIYYPLTKSTPMKTGMVALDELPPTLETVWFRILGKGQTQQEAIEALATLPYDPLRDQVLEIFYKWHADTQALKSLTPEDEEQLMILSEAYKQARQQAVQEGRLEIQHQVVEKLLKLLFW